jgi:CheY-like chemotaxis protein
MEAQLLNAQKFESIGTLAGGIAHDFNNLLMGIQGNVSLALFDLDPRHRLFEIFQNIEKMVKSGSRLTSQLLGYARKGRYEVKPLDINRLIKGISDTFARTRKEIVITHDFSSTLGAVEADEGQIEQALLNILVNAGQAMPKGGKIFIETGNATHKDIDDTTFKVKPGNYVVIRVTDTGAGMDENTRKHVFEPFFTTKEMGRGTGLGLASVYGIIKGHAGYVTVDSELGKGASFRVYLPVSDKAVAETMRMAEKNISGKGTILLVDDEEIVLNVGSRIIEKLGYRVIKAPDGRAALDLYKKHGDAVQMIILDIIMPDMSGSEVFDAIRKINPRAKVLLSSGYSIDGQAAGLLERGCDGFIQKPFTIAELSGKIHEIMEL